jgi:hypothetical protein
MRLDLQAAAVHLARGKAIRVRDGAGSTLQVLAGSVWVTEENSPRDVVLKPGQCWQLARSGLAIIEAFSDASISLLDSRSANEQHQRR